MAGNHYLDDGAYGDDEDDDDDDDDSLSRSPNGAAESRARLVTHRRSTSSGSSDGLPSPTIPMGTIGRLANKLTPDFMRSSVTSSIPENVWTSKSDYAYDTRLLFKRRITTLYISVTSLKSYVEVNYSGFRKILKKHVPACIRRAVGAVYRRRADDAHDTHDPPVDVYAKCVTRGDRSLAKQQLRLHQRENIAWERDTVWRQMIGRARRGDGEIVGAAGASLPGMALNLGFARLRITKKKVALLIAIAVFVALLNTQTVDEPEANRCYAVLMFCTLLWATEAIPLFVTSLMVPLLLVCFSVIRDDEGTPFIFSVMFSPTIMLLIGGFTISSALSKTNIDRVLITRVLSFAGTRPSTVLLAFMGVSCFASMWISSLSHWRPTSGAELAHLLTAEPYRPASDGPARVLGQWFIVALPVSFVSIILIWGLLLASYHPARAPDGGRDLEIKLIRPTREHFTFKQWWVTFVCLVTIALWCFARQPAIESIVGDMGVIAIIPIVAFFATGVLKKDDFEQFAWTIVFLAMGGIALGKGVTQSGLLEVLDGVIRDLLQDVSPYNVVLILSPVVLVISTFISHTIASVLLVPIAKEVGSNLPGPGNHANLLIFVTGLICSAGMGMPVSGFPNQTAATQEDDLGVLYLTNVDFLKNGVPASIIATLVVATIGFLLMKAIG
ncbi:Sodium:sulfate symporter transmembrane region-domain-containing protein [Mycena leptocephala]|nr:Sodium:sulfate symporter transmembrane region-domain-containing protein [Mycena leptocephala]